MGSGNYVAGGAGKRAEERAAKDGDTPLRGGCRRVWMLLGKKKRETDQDGPEKMGGEKRYGQIGENVWTEKFNHDGSLRIWGEENTL